MPLSASFFLFGWPRVDEAKCPPLKLIRVSGGECPRVGERDRLTDHTVNLSESGLCEDWRAGQPREDREGHGVPPDATLR